MINFQCDYLEGAHPKILERLAETNFQQAPGYGNDPFCESARAKIRLACAAPEADIHFLSGGTQTNLIVISSILKPYQGVLAADSGHIACHETGAIEACGHKVLTLPAKSGILSGEQIRQAIAGHRENPVKEHCVQPGMVYISFPTEDGALYRLEELEDLSRACRENGLPLYLDGARLGYALACPENDIALADLSRLCDAFYIGGTKCGALLGEALVIPCGELKKDFRYHIKQRGGMLAKGRLLGLQFDTLFTDGLYTDICQNAIVQAMAIRRAFEAKGIPMLGDSRTNQQFPILTIEQRRRLGETYIFEYWAPYDGERAVVRVCTSWATPPKNTEGLIADILSL